MPRQAGPSISSDILQEAAAWVARLQRSDRSPDADSIALRRWVETSPDHAEALAEATQIWDELGGAGKIFREAERRRGRQWRRLAAGVASLAACLAVVFINYWGSGIAYATPVGGQQQVTLADGSLVFLDSDSRVIVRYTRKKRFVTLEQGSAYFKVAKNPDRPFVVKANNSTTQALGTEFIVQNAAGVTSTTLVEGKVLVAAHDSLFNDTQERPVVLYPGQRWTSNQGHVANLSKIAMEKALVWQSGRLLFDNERLSDAADEFNRYSTIPIVIETENAARVRISGIYNIHDARSFTSAVSALYGLKIVPLRDRLVIAGTPQLRPTEAAATEHAQNDPIPDADPQE